MSALLFVVLHIPLTVDNINRYSNNELLFFVRFYVMM